MFQLIPREEQKKRRCHYCDTWVAVKYRADAKELDRVYYGAEGNVYCCKRCVTRHYIGSNAEIEL